jgi:cytochrome c5
MRVRSFEIALACALALFTHAATRANAQDAQGAQSKPQARAQGAENGGSKRGASDGDAGERAFETHCSRCHNSPEDLSPRTVRAVVRQMRVRAMLTADDERALVKFLAP